MNVTLKFIETVPDKAIFKKIDGTYSSTIILNNLTDIIVIFQIFLNKQTSYSVIPSIGFIEPNSSTTVCINHIEDELNVDQYKLRRILIRGRINF